MSKKNTPARSNYKAPVKTPVDPKKASLKTIIGAVAILVAVVIIIAIVSSLTREGITSAEPNWVVERALYNRSYVYYKVGEVGDIEGYQLDPDASLQFVGELDRTVAYSPTAEDNAIDRIVFYPSPNSYEAAPEKSLSSLTTVETNLEATDPVTGETDVKKYSYFTYTVENPATDTAEASVTQWLVGYVDVDSDTSVMVSIANNGESADDFVEDALLIETFEKAVTALTITD